MDPLSLTDEIIGQLLLCAKTVQSKRPRDTPKGKHIEKNLDVLSDDSRYRFTLITRQSTLIPENYSCGLLWHATLATKVMLARYNGSDHEHKNPLEGDSFSFSCHIHMATERYIAAGRKYEHYATPTKRYNCLEGAMVCLMKDFNINWPNPNIEFDDRQSPIEF
jgi:hypothetical protein